MFYALRYYMLYCSYFWRIVCSFVNFHSPVTQAAHVNLIINGNDDDNDDNDDDQASCRHHDVIHHHRQHQQQRSASKNCRYFD